MDEELKSELFTLLSPDITPEEAKNIIYWDHEYSKISKKQLGPGQGALILNEIPELADYYTVEALNAALDDFWYLYPDHTDPRSIIPLGFANPGVMPAHLSEMYDEASVSMNDYFSIVTVSNRMFLRHNPNAIEIFDLPMKEGEIREVMAVQHHEMLGMWYPELFVSAYEDNYEDNNYVWKDFSRIPQFIRWLSKFLINENEVTDSLLRSADRVDALLSKGESDPNEISNAIQNPLHIPGISPYRDIERVTEALNDIRSMFAPRQRISYASHTGSVISTNQRSSFGRLNAIMIGPISNVHRSAQAKNISLNVSLLDKASLLISSIRDLEKMIGVPRKRYAMDGVL